MDLRIKHEVISLICKNLQRFVTFTKFMLRIIKNNVKDNIKIVIFFNIIKLFFGQDSDITIIKGYNGDDFTRNISVGKNGNNPVYFLLLLTSAATKTSFITTTTL